MARRNEGTIYLLHLESPFYHSNHYLGFARDLEARLTEHFKGAGAKFTQAVRRAGIGFNCVRTWKGTRLDERALKNRRDARSLCPECRADRNAAKYFSKAMKKLGVKRIDWN